MFNLFRMFQRRKVVSNDPEFGPKFFKKIKDGPGFIQQIIDGPNYKFFFENDRNFVPITFILKDKSELPCMLKTASPISIIFWERDPNFGVNGGDRSMFFLSGWSNMGLFVGYYDPIKCNGKIMTTSERHDRITIKNVSLA